MTREPRDPERVRARLVDWIARCVAESGTSGAVIGLSGGVDSSVACALAAEALGPDRCLGVILPIESAPDDARLAREVADAFGVIAVEVALAKPFAALLEALTEARGGLGDAGAGAPVAGDPRSAVPGLARMNLKARLRMTSLYYFSNTLNRLVIGTGNAVEFALGYFTKHGDGGADIFPLGDLVKAEVWALARTLGVPREVIERPPSAGLAPGQTDEGEFGMSYADLDAYFLRGTSGDGALDERIGGLMRGSRHKVASAPIARLD